MGSVKSVLLECCLVGAVGLVIGLAANAMNHSGVRLSRNYFPKEPGRLATQPVAQTQAHPVDSGSTRLAADAEDGMAKAFQELREAGLTPIRHDDVAELFHDPLYCEGVYVIVDARDTKNYTSGHIPGAYQLDHYQIQDYIDQVLPLCKAALKIVVYCNGGKCEDSAFAANDLMEAGLDPSRVFVYPGGMDLWKEKDMPIEKGQRNSGDIVKGHAITGASHD